MQLPLRLQDQTSHFMCKLLNGFYASNNDIYTERDTLSAASASCLCPIFTEYSGTFSEGLWRLFEAVIRQHVLFCLFSLQHPKAVTAAQSSHINTPYEQWLIFVQSAWDVNV